VPVGSKLLTALRITACSCHPHVVAVELALSVKSKCIQVVVRFYQLNCHTFQSVKQRKANVFSCQVTVKHDMSIEVEDDVFGVKKWECTVKSNHNVATFIKELVLELPKGEEIKYRAVVIFRLNVLRTLRNIQILTLKINSVKIGINTICGVMFQM